jgi:hypothetical protein
MFLTRSAYFEILLNLPLIDLLHVCETNHELNAICGSEYFWQQKTIKDFGNNVENLNNLPWYEVYVKEFKLERDRKSLINRFNDIMSAVLNGQETKVFDVSNFNVNNFTRAIMVTLDSSRRRRRSIRPTVLINGRQVLVPIVALPQNLSNFEDFVREIVGRSNYPQLVEPIIQDFGQQI